MPKQILLLKKNGHILAHVIFLLYFCRGKGMKRCRYIVFLLLAGMVGQGCSSRAIHEAEAVVEQADSLWQAGLMYGIDAGDSLSLSQAYETLLLVSFQIAKQAVIK